MRSRVFAATLDALAILASSTMLFAHIGPFFFEAVLLLTTALAAVALAAVVWLIGVVAAALFQSMAVAWLLARLLPRSFKRRWFLRPWSPPKNRHPTADSFR